MTVTIKNATVTWSNMLRKPSKDLLSREFCVELPSDSPEVEKLREQFKELEEKAKKAFTTDKKCKPASREKGLGNSLFSDNDYNPGFTRLKFTIFNINDVEKTMEDGSKKKVREEKLSRIYKDLDFIYKVNNDGKKEFFIDGTTKHWVPNSEDVVDIVCSLCASYNKSDNRVTIRLKADDVKIVKTSYQGGGSKYVFITLDEDQDIETKVENSKPVDEDATFTADELSELDI